VLVFLEHHNNFHLVRLLAALTVHFNHAYPLGGFLEAKWKINGSLAVHVFFTISGFLIFQSWCNSPNLKVFMEKRARRLLPGLWGVILFSGLLLGPCLTTLPLKGYFKALKLGNFLGKFCVPRLIRLPGLFTSNPFGSPVNGSLWTLPYEMCLYCCIGFLGKIFERLWGLKQASSGFLQKISSLQKLWTKGFSSVALLWLIGSILITLKLSSSSAEWKFLGLSVSRLCKTGSFFWMGVLYGQWHLKNPKAFSQFFTIPGVIFSFFVLYYGDFCPDYILYGTLYICLPYLVLAFCLSDSVLKKCKLSFFEKNDFSYGIYIYSFPIQQTFSALGYNKKLWLYNLLSCTTTFILAMISWFYIEKPFLRRKTK
jgi:peptidoglycan/LPS O-acetylase OafA/YrhL